MENELTPHTHNPARTDGCTNGQTALIDALKVIVLETMDYSPAAPLSADSHLPPELVEKARLALALYGVRVKTYIEIERDAINNVGKATQPMIMHLPADDTEGGAA